MQPVLPSFSFSVLSSYFTTGASFSDAGHKAKVQADGFVPTSGSGPAVIAPWQIPLPELEGNEQLNAIFNSDPLIDLDDPLASIDGDNPQFNQLFALHRGLSRMRELVTFAETGSADSLRAILDKRLSGFLDETSSFIDDLTFDDVTLIFGLKDDKLDASIVTPKTLSEVVPFHFGAEAATVRDDPVPGLIGNETFTISVATSSGTTNVAIDLANVVGTLNLDNIASHINGELVANGISTSLGVERYSETSYGIKLNLNAAEAVTLTPDAGSQEGAIYIAGTAGAGDTGIGFLKKFDDLAAGSPASVFRTDIASEQQDAAAGVAIDSSGNVYVVGTSSGDLGDEVNQGSPDVYLRKYDAAGSLLYSRLLGAASNASGFAVTVDSSDNVIVAGQTTDQLSEAAFGGNYDSFVSKFSSAGVELWTRQAAPFANDGALSISTDASDNIFIAGYANGAVGSGTTHVGGSDAFLSKIDGDGVGVWDKQFGSVGNDRATGIAVDNAGSVYVAAESGGNAVLRKYTDEASSQTPVWEVDLGAVNSDGGVTGVAVGDGGNVYISGFTSNAALNGTIAQAHSGGVDGFVSRIVDSGVSASIGTTTYVGGTGNDTIQGITVRADAGGDEVYVTGNTTGSIGGQAEQGDVDGFVTRLNEAGTSIWTEQFGGPFVHKGQGIAYDATGTSVISRLGLPAGPLPVEPPTDIGSITSARAGQYFSISVNGELARRVTIEEGDTYGLLAAKVNKILGKFGAARNEKDIDGRRFSIEALLDARIDIFAGPEGQNALPSLGLAEATLFAATDTDDDADDDSAGSSSSSDDEIAHEVFALGLFDTINVLDKTAAADAGLLIDSAMLQVRKAFDRLNGTDSDNPLDGVQISADDRQRIAALQLALDRLTASSASPEASLFNLSV